MPKAKKYIYSPNTIVLDMKKQPDAEEMIRIAKAIKGSKVETIKGGQIVEIHYPETKVGLSNNTKAKISGINIEGLESKIAKITFYQRMSHKTKKDESTEARLYHALILK